MRTAPLFSIHFLVLLASLLWPQIAWTAVEKKTADAISGLASRAVATAATTGTHDPDKYFIKHSYSLGTGHLSPWVLSVFDHNVWIYGEFSNSLHVLRKTAAGNYPDAKTTTTTGLRVPMVVDRNNVDKNAPFRNVLSLVPGPQTDLSSAGEAITADEYGRIWFTQGPGGWSAAETISYSRVVSYDPGENRFCVYNIPDNKAGVFGIAWDSARQLIWFTQASVHDGVGAIVSFDPNELSECGNDYVWKLNQRVPENPFRYNYCSSPAQRDCFRKYILPASFYVEFERAAFLGLPNMYSPGAAAQLVVAQPPHPDAGAVWYTLALGDAIGRLDPDAPGGGITHFPIGDDPFSVGFININNAGPWDIDINPVNEDIVFTGYGGKLLGKFDISQYKSSSYSGECESVSGSGIVNPCMQLLPVPGLSKVSTTHQLDVDPFGNTWFTIAVEGCFLNLGSFPHKPASIGFVDKDWTEVVMFGFLDFATMPKDSDSMAQRRLDASGRLSCAQTLRDIQGNDWSLTGIDAHVEGKTFNIWLTESNLKKIRRLEYRFDADENIYCKIRGCP